MNDIAWPDDYDLEALDGMDQFYPSEPDEWRAFETSTHQLAEQEYLDFMAGSDA